MNANKPTKKLIQLHRPNSISLPTSNLLRWLVHDENLIHNKHPINEFEAIEVKTVKALSRNRKARNAMKRAYKCC
jgi:hypothetical protein